MRSRSANAAALYQSCLVAMPASLPIASRSLARMALLISVNASSSMESGAEKTRIEGSDKLDPLRRPPRYSTLYRDRNPAFTVRRLHEFHARTGPIEGADD